MKMSMKKIILALLMLITGACLSNNKAECASMAAYQKAYAMNFDIWKPSDLPAGWYATFDGFPVAQIAENRWVYGQLGMDGAIRPTNILVGSVIPSSVPGLLRIAAVWNYSKAINSPEYMKIRKSFINRMGWLCDDGMNTIVAWHTSKPVIWVWLGNRWIRLEPNPGEYIWQMLKRWRGFIIEELGKNTRWFYIEEEPLEAADLARQWGYIWTGKVVLRTLRNYRNDGGSGNVTSLHDNSGGSNNNTPEEPSKNNHGQWDVD